MALPCQSTILHAQLVARVLAVFGLSGSPPNKLALIK